MKLLSNIPFQSHIYLCDSDVDAVSLHTWTSTIPDDMAAPLSAITLLVMSVLCIIADCGDLKYMNRKVIDIGEREMEELTRNLNIQTQQHEHLVKLVRDLLHERTILERNTCEKEVFHLDIQKELDDILDNKRAMLDNDYGSKNREHEHYRRKIENGIEQYWFYLKSQLSVISDLFSTNFPLVRSIIKLRDDTVEHYRMMMANLYSYSLADGTGLKRKAELDDLSEMIQHRIHYIQNPSSCTNTKKLLCTIEMTKCGFGCLVHHLVDCLIVAYATKRAIVLDSDAFLNADDGWETIFLPLSETCSVRDLGNDITPWGNPESLKHVPIVEMPKNGVLDPRPSYMPLAVPDDFAEKLGRLHGQPGAWWMGQLVKYILRGQQKQQQELGRVKRREKFQHPIVGVHVRRTGNPEDATFHEIEEYMEHVEEYYKLLRVRENFDVKRVYLATEAEHLLEEAKTKYPEYEFISNTDQQFSTGDNFQQSAYVIKGIAIDIHLLSQTDFLVCAFSSNVCRLSYELMQTQQADASSYFHSMDVGYYVERQSTRHQRAICEYTARDNNELSLEAGDLLQWEAEWNGMVKGRSDRLGTSGRYFRYMVEDVTREAEFTSYQEVDMLRNV